MGAIEFLDSRILGFCAYFWAKMPFFGKKGKNFFGPKMVQKWPKSGQKWPKLPQNRRNKSRRSPRKSQQIPKISEKWPKTLPQCNMKMHQKRKNGQKSAKIMEKIDFPYNNFPKKGISLRKFTQKIYFRLKVKKFFRACGALYRCDPGGGGL